MKWDREIKWVGSTPKRLAVILGLFAIQIGLLLDGNLHPQRAMQTAVNTLLICAFIIYFIVSRAIRRARLIIAERRRTGYKTGNGPV